MSVVPGLLSRKEQLLLRLADCSAGERGHLSEQVRQIDIALRLLLPLPGAPLPAASLGGAAQTQSDTAVHL